MKTSEALAPSRSGRITRAVALVEVIGASWSIAVLSKAAFSISQDATPWQFLFGTFGAFGFVGFAGLALLRGRAHGLPLSIAAQLCQVVQLNVGDLGLRFIAGPHASIVLTESQFRVYAGLTASLNLWRPEGEPSLLVSVNIVALAALVWLLVAAAKEDTGSNPVN